MLLLFFAPQIRWDGTGASGYDLTLTANDVVQRLGAVSFADLTWLSQAQIFAYFDEAAKRLAVRCGGFVDRIDSTSLAGNVAQYAAPAGWTSTIHVSANGLRLRPASTQELEALDCAWQQTPGAPTRYSMDAGPLGTITVYPLPQPAQNGQPLAVIQQEFPPGVSPSQTIVPAPAPASDYFLYFALMRARGHEGEGAMPEMAQHFAARCALYEQILGAYYGEGE